MTNSNHGNFDQFLTPEAMLTPGVAGSMSMMIANTLNYQFDLPNGWCILALSFVFGLLVLANSKPLLTRSVLYVLNSLVIFCVAAGTTTLGAKARADHAELFQLTTSAYAQANTATTQLQADYSKLSADSAALGIKIDAARRASAPAAEIDRMVQDRAEIDRKRSAVLKSLIDAEARAKADTPNKKGFFAPLRF